VADRTIEIITPAANSDLLTLDEAKMLLGINAADTSQDPTLEFMIEIFSETCAEIANRQPTVTFGKEEVLETWREIGNGRLFLSHWPVLQSDLISVNAAGVDLDPTQYELETASGKLSNVTVSMPASLQWQAPVIVHYKGGYTLPDEAPKPLKHACILLMREERIRMIAAQTAGIRQISHKEARVAFFDPNAVLLRSLGAKSPTMMAAENLLKQYMRFEV
jgi:hypothetical protein